MPDEHDVTGASASEPAAGTAIDPAVGPAVGPEARFASPAGSVRAFLAIEALGLRVVAGLHDGDDSVVSAVAPVAGLDDIDAAGRDAMVVVMPEWGRRLDGYQVDVALRHAVEAGIGAVVFDGPRNIATSTRHLAQRAGLPLVVGAGPVTGWRLLLELDRRLRQPDAELVSRVRAGVAAVTGVAADPAGDLEHLLTAASGALGGRIRWARKEQGRRGQESTTVTMDRPDPAAELVLPLVAAQADLLRIAERARSRRPARARSQLMLQLLLADRSHVGDVADAAADAGLPVHSTHVGGWLVVTEADPDARAAAADQRVAAAEHRWSVLEEVEAALWEPAPRSVDAAMQWHVSAMADGIAVCCTGDTGTPELYRIARQRVQGLVDHWRAAPVSVTAGLGGAAAGPEGLRRSVAEARVTAERAFTSGRAGSLSDTDRVGLRRVLADLSASPLSSGLLADVLAPLEDLPSEKAEIAVVTLNAYLDAQGSPTKAAAALHLHPNAVAYRLKWIGELLPVDLTDADQRFAVHLACRIHLLRLLAAR